MDIVTIRRHRDNEAVPGSAHNSEKHARYEDDDIYHGSPDKDYMKHCHEVDLNPPKTWEKYDVNTAAGMKKIIEMEYRELMSATTHEDTVENIYHLSVALLRFWRLHNDTDHHTGTH